jgi:uncharacterized protein (TIGR00156 family)
MKNLVLISLLFISTAASSQFVSSESKIHSVQYVKDNSMRYSFTDRTVRLQGYIVEHIREDYYLFRDDTGDMRVEIYPSRMPSTPFTKDTRVTLTGEVDLFFLRPEIYVSSISLIDQENTIVPDSNPSAVSTRSNYQYDYY